VNLINLPSRWRKAWREIGALSDDVSAYNELVKRYSEPHRAYHNLEHISECLLHFDSALHLLARPIEAELAVWFHDVIYDTRGVENEELSASFAATILHSAGVENDNVQRIVNLIRTTSRQDLQLFGDAAIVADVDLAILGAGPDRFNQYELAIRMEYDWVPAPLYRRERRRILEQFLNRPHVFHNSFFREKFESQARANLHYVIERYVI
jgi:predicted metal-dependent HD superfamily phosphohydrolase